ncbi:MAG: hypothetical protein GTN99_10495 [Candidatus Dadabacteria bacterium]|nr:hypothetical protein [Candidatus Dadabacteria bacterium]NIT14643.1 hypothetical protein [Candidatus Dadabacteria bacterium]
MNKKIIITLTLITLTITGCSGSGGAGHWFHILFVLIPLGISLYFLNKKVDDISKSLFKVEGQISQLASKLERSEDKNK